MSNLSSLQVLHATTVPEPGGLALVLPGLAGAAALWHRTMPSVA